MTTEKMETKRTTAQIDDAMKALRARGMGSDPFMLDRVMSHFKLGVCSLEDIQKGYGG